MVEILIIGGTRNLGHLLALELLQAGHRVTVFNRGQTPDQLPDDVRRLHGDRSDPAQLAQALVGRSFDVVVDMTLYNGTDAQTITGLLEGRVGHYIFLSTGQVYLVRRDVQRPFAEADYDGPLTEAPDPNTRDHEEWTYGVEKRQAEDILAKAWESRRFPYTSLRLSIVNSERDHFHRIYGYLLRLQDGGPILIPTAPHLPLRHVYGGDVVSAIMVLINTGVGKGRAYNISQDETLALEDFLALLAGLAGYELRLASVNAQWLESRNLLLDCSPFSDPWMSALDNRRSKEELGLQCRPLAVYLQRCQQHQCHAPPQQLRYTPLVVYLQRLIAYYETHRPPIPGGYRRRWEELELALQQKL
jgi:nucleoside-diphosphate-sugar epimerase